MNAPHPQLREIGTIVVGGGIVGLFLSGFLALEGLDVALIDDGTGGGSTANAGSLHVQMQSRFMRLFPTLVPEFERQLPLYPKAVQFWKALQTELDADFDLKITGGLMIAETAEQLEFLHVKSKRERALGLDVEILERGELQRIAPYLGPSAYGAEFCANEGKLNPLLCNAAVRRWAVSKGVVLLEEESVLKLGKVHGGFDVTTSRGVIRAGHVALAAGAGTRKLAAWLGAHVPVDPEPLHMNITEPTTPLIGHLVQHAERSITLKQFGSGQIVIGGGWPAHLSEKRSHPTVELASLIGNATLAQYMVPKIAPLRIIRTWAGINSKADGRGVLGAFPGVDGLFIAIPGDAGYTLGPLSARLVADTMLRRTVSEDLTPYSPERFLAPAKYLPSVHY